VQSDEQLRSEAGQQPGINAQHVIPRADVPRMHPSDGRHGLAVSTAVPPQSFNPIAMSRSDWRPVVRSPEQLRLHPALKEIGLMEELSAAVLKEQYMPELIFITRNGTILTGFGAWQSAICDGQHEINCIEYLISEEEILPFILSYHQRRRGWNDFVLIRVGLKLKPYYQRRAIDNMRDGGRYKGLANLPEAQHIDVRQEIARDLGVGARNVSNVERILEVAHERIIEALGDGTLRINRAIQLCKCPRAEQLEQFIRYSEERAINKVIRQSIARLNKNKPSPDAASVLETLQQREAQQSGSVAVRIGRQQRTVVVIGQDLKHQYCQTALKLT
jgi:hypothetical protein